MRGSMRPGRQRHTRRPACPTRRACRAASAPVGFRCPYCGPPALRVELACILHASGKAHAAWRKAAARRGVPPSYPTPLPRKLLQAHQARAPTPHPPTPTHLRDAGVHGVGPQPDRGVGRDLGVVAPEVRDGRVVQEGRLRRGQHLPHRRVVHQLRRAVANHVLQCVCVGGGQRGEAVGLGCAKESVGTRLGRAGACSGLAVVGRGGARRRRARGQPTKQGGRLPGSVGGWQQLEGILLSNYPRAWQQSRELWRRRGVPPAGCRRSRSRRRGRRTSRHASLQGGGSGWGWLGAATLAGS